MSQERNRRGQHGAPFPFSRDAEFRIGCDLGPISRTVFLGVTLSRVRLAVGFVRIAEVEEPVIKYGFFTARLPTAPGIGIGLGDPFHRLCGAPG